MRYRLKDDGDGWWSVQTCWKYGLFWNYGGVVIKQSEFPHVLGAIEEAKRRIQDKLAAKETYEFTLGE